MKYSIWKIPANISTLSFSPVGKTIKYKTSVLAETASFEAGEKILIYSEEPNNSFNIGITIIEQNEDSVSFVKDFEIARGVNIDTLESDFANKILASSDVLISITESEYQSIRSLLFSQEMKDPKTTQNNTPTQQIIYYGAPGTGKSYGIRGNHGVTRENSFRTTFHPDSDYSTFVGCYKPIKDSNGEITYDFVPQVFTEAYVAAWRKYAEDKPIFLIIEEINRGNCAQIFGDLFQLLDRDERGFSDYEIKPEKDLQKFLNDEFAGKHNTDDNPRPALELEDFPNIVSGKELLLPPNLNIIATMNTSDQSLFPIDSAFKRRWSWRYIAIKDMADKNYRIKIGDALYKWWDFINIANEKICALTSSEDKKMGYFFVRPDEKEKETDSEATIISTDLFVSKVLFYLWTDVFKDYSDDTENNIFRVVKGKDDNGNDIYEPISFTNFFDDKGKVNPKTLDAFLTQFDELKPTNQSGVDMVEAGQEDEDGNTATSSNRDYTKYSVNNTGRYGKNRLAAEAVKEYVRIYPDLSADEVVSNWKSLGNIVPHFIETKEEHESRQDNNSQRTCEILCNGTYIYVATDGYGGNGKVEILIEEVNRKDWGITLEVVDE